MSWDEFHQNQQRERRDQERQQREKSLRDQQQRQHEGYMKQQDDHFDRLRKEGGRRDPSPRGGAPLVVWYFGAIGALFGGLNPPPGWDWFFGGTLGFLLGGFLGGYLRQFGWGRAVLWIVGLGFAGLIAFGIYFASRPGP
jgi:hypothetical protein